MIPFEASDYSVYKYGLIIYCRLWRNLFVSRCNWTCYSIALRSCCGSLGWGTHECVACVSSRGRTPPQRVDHLVPSILNGPLVIPVLEQPRLKPFPSKFVLFSSETPARHTPRIWLTHAVRLYIGFMRITLCCLRQPYAHVITSHSGPCRTLKQHNDDWRIGKKEERTKVCIVLCDPANVSCETRLYVSFWACRIEIPCAAMQWLRPMLMFSASENSAHCCPCNSLLYIL